MNTLRHAWRSLARSKGFVIVAVLALGLGLGLSTTMFAVMDAVINPFVPYRDPDGLYRVRWWYSRRDVHVEPGALYHAVHDQTRAYEAMIPIGGTRLPLEEDDGREVFAARVTPQFFPLTGVRPALGRGFVESDGEDVVVLSHELFRRLFGRRSIDGVKVTLGDRTYAVVGVMPRGEVVPGFASVWLPLPVTVDPALTMDPLVRLKPGVTLAQANAELKSISAVLTQQLARRDRPIAIELYAVRQRQEQLRDLHKAMVGAALSVLIIACVNLAHLMLARGLAKRRELALRMALGASRARVVWQMFAECALVTIGGAALGALGAVWGADILANRMPPSASWVGLIQPQLSWRVFALSALAAAVSAVLFGLLPAIKVALSLSLDEPLKDGAGTTGRTLNRYNGLVVAEVGLALVLLMGGGLLIRSIQQARRIEFSFDARTLLQGSVGFRTRGDSTQLPQRDAILAAVSAVPGVRDVAFSEGRGVPGDATTGEMVGGDSTRTIRGGYSSVSWRYLRTWGLQILNGRDFEPGDASGNGAAILDAAAAVRLYPNQDAVGRMIKLGAPSRDAPWVRIIGVARSPMSTSGRTRIGNPEVWVVGGDRAVQGGQVFVRTERQDPKTTALVRRTLRGFPSLMYADINGINAWWEASLASQAFLARVFVSIGLVALGLSSLGLYGVLAYAVNQRMREFAVRVALGAQPKQLFRMVMKDGFVMLLAGIAIGAFVALMASRLLDSVLPDSVLPSDVITLVGAEAVLMLSGLAAALGPARRAVKADPLDILRAT